MSAKSKKRENKDSLKQESKKTVLFIGPYPPPYSGPELGMKLFLGSSLKDVFIIHFLKTNFRKTNVSKGRLDYQMIKAFFIFNFKLIFSLIRYKPDLVYYPIMATQIGWIGRDIWCLLFSRLFGSKIVIHLRGGHLKLNSAKFNPFVRYIVRYTCSFVSLALVQAECLRDQFYGLVPDERIRVLYNAVDTSEYINDNIKDYDPGKIVFMGHLTKAKGYCDAVRAIPLVADNFPEVKFYFAGTLRRGERGVFFDQTNGKRLIYEDPFKLHNEIIKGKYARNYSCLGVVTGKDKFRLLKDANLFILPSYSEGFSLAVLEAMNMGKPVICSTVGALREIIINGENGFLIKPGDFHELAEKILCLIRDPGLRNQIAGTNFRVVRENFDSKKISKQLGLYFKSVLT